MKIRKLICLLLLLAGLKNANILTAQTTSTNNLTPNGVLDSVYDQYGLVHQLSDLMIGSTSQSGNSASLSAVAATCVAGYFTLHFGAGLFFDNNIPAQTVACQVFSDISLFINSSIPSGAIHILCGTSTTGLGVATSYFVFPNAPINPNQGYTDNLVYRALTSGVNPYSTLPIAYSPGGFYHAALDIYPLTNGPYWNYNLTSTTVASNEHDLYCVILHEVAHMLGFTSAINFNGTSLFGTSNNLYTRYDQFLKDNSGSNLVAPSSSACPNANVTFVNTASNVALGGNCATGPLDASTCSIAARYISSINQAVFTPTCYLSGSSLSHFEDMCTTFTSACIPTPATPDYNNLIFVMSNKNDPGSCYVKRNLHPYEKQVLCDLGYSLNSSYGSTVVAGSQITYTSGCSSGLPIGVNDGISAGNYVFVTTTNSAVISYSTLLNNDISASSASVSCLEALTLGSSISGGLTTCTLSATTGTGLVIFKYYPVNSNGYGNVTYVFVYFLPAGCSNGNSCNLIRNSGFENTTTAFGNLCGIVGPTSVSMDCWENYTGTSMLLSSNCTLTPYVPGVNTFNSAPPTNTLNFGSVSNNNFTTLQYSGPAFGTNKASIKNLLNGQLQTGQTYNLSFFGMNMSSAFNSTATSYFNPDNNPIVVTIASHPNWAFTPTLNFPTGLNVISSFTLAPSTAWSLITNTFVYTPTVNASAVIIGINVLSTSSPTNFTSLGMYYFLLDEFQITPYSGAFTIPQNTLCGTPSYTNLANYTGTLSGAFFGQGVTQSGANFLFNSPSVLPYGNYPVGFTYTNGVCNTTLYQYIMPGTCCNSTTIPEFSANTVTTNVFVSGTTRIASDFTIQPGGNFFFQGGEFLMTNNSRVVVENGAILFINGAHLYSCGADLWKGIVVKDGGRVLAANYNGNDNLIEDALVAIDVPNNYTSTANPVLDIWNTTFNKNYIDVQITSYTRTATGYENAFQFHHTVFSCRNFTYTSTLWPSSSISDLRAANQSTTGLASPYELQNAPVAFLKNPYANRHSAYALNIQNYNLADQGLNFRNTNANDFILFDSHEHFIFANAKVRVNNCVFQNTLKYSIVKANGGIRFMGASALASGFDGDFTSSSIAKGNRFWNCHLAIAAQDKCKIDNTIIRSVSTTTSFPLNATYCAEGGIFLGGVNNQYSLSVSNCELTNIHNSICFGSGSWTNSTVGSLAITGNTISPVSSLTSTNLGANYVQNAIWLSHTPYFQSINCYSNSITISNNILNKVFNGISVNNNSIGRAVVISGNEVSLQPDNIFYNNQVGIGIVNTIGTACTWSNIVVASNTLSTESGTTMTGSSLVYCANNFGPMSPRVTCNSLSEGYNGFEFSGSNIGTYWRGNDMTDLARGMVLSNTGIIGTQGAGNAPQDNQWRTGTNPWSSYYGTYAASGSTALGSPLFYQSSGNFIPPSPGGSAGPLTIYGAIGSLSISSSGSYSCNGSPYQSIYLPPFGDYDNEDSKLTAMIGLYEFLSVNDSVRIEDPDLAQFYDDQAGTVVKAYHDILLQIQVDNFSGASTGISALPDPLSTVEQNYYDFFPAFLNYRQMGDSLIYADSIVFGRIANSCFDNNGPVVFLARALLCKHFGVPLAFSGCTEVMGKPGFENKKQPFNFASIRTVYPNPANTSLFITTIAEKDSATLQIFDVLGNRVSSKLLLFDQGICKTDLELANGIYLIRITNKDGSVQNQRLLIER